jgi:hypothetical protein
MPGSAEPPEGPGWVHGVASSTQPGLATRYGRAAEGFYAPRRGRRMAARRRSAPSGPPLIALAAGACNTGSIGCSNDTGRTSPSPRSRRWSPAPKRSGDPGEQRWLQRRPSSRLPAASHARRARPLRRSPRGQAFPCLRPLRAPPLRDTEGPFRRGWKPPQEGRRGLTCSCRARKFNDRQRSRLNHGEA